MIRYLTAGESHGEALVGIVEGLPAGVPLAPDAVDRHLARRWKGRPRRGEASRTHLPSRCSGGDHAPPWPFTGGRPSISRASAGEAGSMFSSCMMRTERATSISFVASTPRS